MSLRAARAPRSARAATGSTGRRRTRGGRRARRRTCRRGRSCGRRTGRRRRTAPGGTARSSEPAAQGPIRRCTPTSRIAQTLARYGIACGGRWWLRPCRGRNATRRAGDVADERAGRTAARTACRPPPPRRRRGTSRSRNRRRRRRSRGPSNVAPGRPDRRPLGLGRRRRRRRRRAATGGGIVAGVRQPQRGQHAAQLVRDVGRHARPDDRTPAPRSRRWRCAPARGRRAPRCPRPGRGASASRSRASGWCRRAAARPGSRRARRAPRRTSSSLIAPPDPARRTTRISATCSAKSSRAVVARLDARR